MASTPLDMTLDDLIKTNKTSKASAANPKRRRGGARGGANGGDRNLGPAPRRFKTRGSKPSGVGVKAPESAWKHDMFAETNGGSGNSVRGGGRSAGIETGTKLLISNLDYGVSGDDIKELFSEMGDLKRCVVHYDRSGRSKGTAEVVFSRRSDAMVAVKKYNNVQLDGKPMNIEVVGTNISTPAVPPAASRAFGKANGSGRGGKGGRGAASSRPRGGRRFGRGGGGGGGPVKSRPEKVSAEDLDADLEKYHSEAMQTN